MRLRTLPILLTTAATAATLHLAGHGPAGAAEAEGSAWSGATCYGLPATVVPDPGTDTVLGTQGDDVIVAEDVSRVEALGGDDTVCVVDVGWVDAGDGDDRVRSWQDGRRHSVVLGSGSDVFEGSAGPDRVWAERFDGEDPFPGTGPDNTDTVRTYGGADRVTSGDLGQANRDRVSLGRGDDVVAMASTADGELDLAGGRGADALVARLRSDAAFDLGTGVVTADGAPLALAGGFEELSVDAFGSSVEVVGTDGPDRIGVTGRADVRTGAGNDVVSVLGDPHGLVGGAGRDLVTVLGYSDLEDKAVLYDLGRRLFTRGDVTARLATERLHVGWTGALREDVRVLGSRRPDVVSVQACGAVVHGKGGEDRLRSETEQCEDVPLTLRGGAGDDVLRGAVEVDVLIGGTGHDRADGSDGVDRCRAEVERRCERD